MIAVPPILKFTRFICKMKLAVILFIMSMKIGKYKMITFINKSFQNV